MNSVIILTQTKLLTWSKAFAMVFTYSTFLKSATGNMASALLNPQVIDNYLQSEVQTGRVAGLFSQSHLSVPHVSRFGITLKCHPSGKWRLILDLSSPAMPLVSTTEWRARIILCST